jgi:hypothetical protein
MHTFTAPKHYKDPDKIREYVATQKETFMEKAALDAMRAEIVVAGLLGILDAEPEFFCVDPTIVDYKLVDGEGYEAHYFGNEADLLVFLLAKLDPKKRLIGQALTSFHLPMLIRRCLRHGFRVHPRFLPRPRYFDSYNCFDFCEAWSLGKSEDKYVSLENLILFFFPGHDPKDLPLSVTDSTTIVNRFRKGPITTLTDLTIMLGLIQEIAPQLYLVRNHPIPDLKR